MAQKVHASFRAKMPLTRTIALAVSVILIVMSRSTNAAPQTDVATDVKWIDGQKCLCVPFYLCDSSDTVNIPPGSTELGCLPTMTCCLVKDGNLPVTDTNTFVSSSEIPQITPEPIIDKPQCSCVTKNQCSEQQSFGIRDCSQNNEICCNEQNIIPGNTQEPTNSNNVLNCGVGMSPLMTQNPIDTRITNSEGASNTYFGQFPWMVALLKTETDEQTGSITENVFQCGGSLVHPRIVLTAAHCLNGVDMNSMKVRLGEWDTQSSNNQEEKFSHHDISISRVFIHPKHNNESMFNDVALIELISAAKSQQNINTICIPSNENQLNYDSRSCVSTGWGKDGFEQHSRYQNVLRKVELSLVPNDLCQRQLRNTRLGSKFNLHHSFICAGGVKGVDACRGDGGGPLICAVNGETPGIQKYVQVGIVSWGIGCGVDQVPGVYSSVVANSQWINNQLQIITQ